MSDLYSITITKSDLRRALAQWEKERRDGKCMPQEEADALSLEKHAELGAERLWDDLVKLS